MPSLRAVRGVMGAGGSASVGIARLLEGWGVHGAESAILPALLKFNAPANAGRQWEVKTRVWAVEGVSEMLEGVGLTVEGSDLGDAVKGVFGLCGLPVTLDVEGTDWNGVLDASLAEGWAVGNAVPLRRREQIFEVLALAGGEDGNEEVDD